MALTIPRLTKYSSRAEIDRQLEEHSLHHQAYFARLLGRPVDFVWAASALKGQIERSSAAERPVMYRRLAVSFWSAGRKDLARKAVKVHLRIKPPTEFDRLLDGGRERFRKALLAIGPPEGGPHKSNRKARNLRVRLVSDK